MFYRSGDTPYKRNQLARLSLINARVNRTFMGSGRAACCKCVHAFFFCAESQRRYHHLRLTCVKRKKGMNALKQVLT